MALVEHLEKLRHFNLLSRFRSISGAAESLHVSQAGLSKSLTALESVLGVRLFLRSSQGLVLTKEGELTLVATKKILAEASSLETSLRSLHAAKAPRKLTVGMYDSIAVYFFSELATYLGEIYQGVAIELLVDTSAQLAAAVQSGRIDLCIGVNLHQAVTKVSEFVPLFEDHYSFYVSTKEPAAVPSRRLIFHPTATDANGVTTQTHLAALIKSHGAHRAFHFETIKTLTSQGLGIGVLPTQVARPLVAQRQLQPFSMPNMKSTFGSHSIGFLVARRFFVEHRDFASDVFRLGQRWANA